mgnify:CR=1 FL=1
MSQHRKSKRSFLITQIVAALFLIMGAAVALYPFYVGGLNDVIDNYRAAIVQKQNAKRATTQIAAMMKKNKALAKKGMNANADPFNGKTAKEKTDLKKEMIGKVTVPGLKLTVPLFKTLTEETLEVGAAVVDGTSMPVGGKGTHTVIAGHRGLVNRRLFSDLNRVHKGNVFVLNVYGKHLAYKVFRIQTVKPDNTQVLKLEDGRDLATLMTCTPYMVNTHRLLITGYRVPYTQKIAKSVAQSESGEKWQQLAIVAAALVALLGVLGLLGRWIHTLLLRRCSYDLVFYRQDANGKPLAGVTYQLCKPNGKKLYRQGQVLAATTDAQGRVEIKHLPGGMYRLKDLSAARGWTIKLGTKKLKQTAFNLYPSKVQRHVVQRESGEWFIRR